VGYAADAAADRRSASEMKAVRNRFSHAGQTSLDISFSMILSARYGSPSDSRHLLTLVGTPPVAVGNLANWSVNSLWIKDLMFANGGPRIGNLANNQDKEKTRPRPGRSGAAALTSAATNARCGARCIRSNRISKTVCAARDKLRRARASQRSERLPQALPRRPGRSPRWIDLLTQSHYNHRGLWVIHLFQIHTPLLPLPLTRESGTP